MNNKLFILIFSLFAVANIFLFVFISKPGRGNSYFLSAFVSPTALYTRVSPEMVESHFSTIIKSYYKGMAIKYPGSMFKKEIFDDYFSECNDNFLTQNFCLHQDMSKLIQMSSASLWYNPIVYSPKSYRIIDRRPLVTDPEIITDYPIMMLFIKNNDLNNQTIYVFLCNKYLIFIPKYLFIHMQHYNLLNNVHNTEFWQSN